MEITVDSKVLSRLLYMRKQIDERIDNEITESVLRGKKVDPKEFRSHIDYVLDDQFEALRQGR